MAKKALGHLSETEQETLNAQESLIELFKGATKPEIQRSAKPIEQYRLQRYWL